MSDAIKMRLERNKNSREKNYVKYDQNHDCLG